MDCFGGNPVSLLTPSRPFPHVAPAVVTEAPRLDLPRSGKSPCPLPFAAQPRAFIAYGEHRDFALDAASVDALLAQAAVSQRDKDEATSVKKRLVRWVLKLADHLPFLIPHVANERMRLHLRDLRLSLIHI